MSIRNGRYCAALGGLAAVVLIGAAPVETKDQPQRSANAGERQPSPKANGDQGPTAFERESLAIDRAANRIAERANLIAETQRSYAFWQLVLGGIGVAFTAIAAVAAIAAAFYAKQAAKAAGDSAKADNLALEQTRKAAADARKDADVQVERFAEQMAKQQELVEFTAKTAYAMDHAATAMRRNAQASGRQADIAEETAKRHLQAYVHVSEARLYWNAVDRPYFTLTVVNTGQTPAQYFEIGAECEIVGASNEAIGKPPGDFLYVTWSAIGGGATLTAEIVDNEGWGVTRTAFGNTKNSRLSVRGRVRYLTIFDELFESEFTFFRRVEDLFDQDKEGKFISRMGAAPAKLAVYQKVKGDSARESA